MLENKLKLVIWDLDDTFWDGTLAEGGVTPVTRNIDLVKLLAHRGIISSICSKNDESQARAKLVEFGIDEYFVFPRISFDPKGRVVAEMLETAGLRSENTLFLDDNRLNLEEVKYFNSGIMAGHPADVLDALADHPNAAGKPDPELTRLKQYRSLQRKSEDRAGSMLSNEEFLRESDIRIAIDYDVEANFDRVVELINRANQLNYTKKRLETPEALAEFRELLKMQGSHAGCVRASDRYGDYGLIGFFVLRRNAGMKRLLHFVFSCRSMHMGIEQYIYEMLDCPDIRVVNPVSYGLDSHAEIDWITRDFGGSNAVPQAAGKKLVLLGGCELLQLANYCSADRIEFVNKMQDGMRVRFDSPGFVLSAREAVRNCESLRKIPWWTYDDAIRFDEGIASAEMILLHMWTALWGEYFKTRGNVQLHFTKRTKEQLEKSHPEWLKHDVKVLALSGSRRMKLIMDSFDAISSKSSKDCRIFVLGFYTLVGLDEKQQKNRTAINRQCRAYCEARPEKFEFVDVDAIVPPEHARNSSHYARQGYFMLAREILSSVNNTRDTSEKMRGMAHHRIA